MSTINIRVVDRQLIPESEPFIPSGGKNIDRIAFEFTDEWENFDKTAVFYSKNSEVYNIAVNSDNVAIIPEELLINSGRIHFGVFGIYGNERITSDIYTCRIEDGAFREGINPMADIISLIEKDHLKVFANDFILQIGNALLMYADELITASSNSCLRIKTQVFSHCYKLRDIHFPKVNRINDNGFLDCYSLESVEFPELISMGNSVFEFNNDGGQEYSPTLKTVDIPKAHFIGLNSFRGCSSLEEVNAPEVKGIGNYCFHNCESLEELNLPELLYLGGKSFNYTGLKNLIMPKLEGIYSSISYDTVNDTIAVSGAGFTDELLKGSNSLVKLNLGNTPLTGVFGKLWDASAAFDTQNQIVPSTLKEITCHLGTAYNAFRGCENIESVNVKTDGILRIPFYGMTNLKWINNPNKTEKGNTIFADEIKDSSFLGCRNLEYLNVMRTADVRTECNVRVSAFNGCAKLEKIFFEGGVGGNINFGDSAFANCENLELIYVRYGQCGTVGNGLFANVQKKVDICVISSYKDEWKDKFAEYIASGKVFITTHGY